MLDTYLPRREALNPDRQSLLNEEQGRRDGLEVQVGRAVARAIGHATYVRIPGMGHDLPRQLWPELVRQIAGHVLANPT